MYRDSCEHGIISPCIYLKNSQLTQRCLTVHPGKCWLSVVSQCAVLSVCGGCAAALKLSSHYRLPGILIILCAAARLLIVSGPIYLCSAMT